MRAWLVIILFLLVLNVSEAEETVTKLKKDEDVILFPAMGWRNPEGGWFIELHGWVYETEARKISLAALQKLIGLKLDDLSAEEQKFFKARTSWFLVDNERGKHLEVTLMGEAFALGKTEPNGRVKRLVAVLEDKCQELGLKAGTNEVFLKLPPGEEREEAGPVHFIAEEGWTVVSDIDDTIKVTEVRNREALLRNTFCKEFRAAEGMAKVYAQWAEEGAVFHYVSASPWQLYPDLETFRAVNGYPAGTFHLRNFRLKDETGVEFLKGSRGFKPGEIGVLLDRFPRRKFVLVGDSGEHDPEIYGELARKHPEKIVRILIRDVTGDETEGERYRAAFQGVAREKWAIFKHPDAVKDLGPLKTEEKTRR